MAFVAIVIEEANVNLTEYIIMNAIIRNSKTNKILTFIILILCLKPYNINIIEKTYGFKGARTPR